MMRCTGSIALMWSILIWEFIALEPLRNFTPWPDAFFTRVVANTFYGLMLSIPFIPMLFDSYFRRIKEAFRARGIIVHGWHWRGIEVDETLLHEFRKCLVKHGLLNDGALGRMIEATRDELLSRTRPQTSAYAFCAIIFALVISVCQPLWEKALELSIHNVQDFANILVLTLSICFMVLVLSGSYLLTWISPRTELETYLQTLHTLHLSLSTQPPEPKAQAIAPKSQSDLSGSGLLNVILLGLTLIFFLKKDYENRE